VASEVPVEKGGDELVNRETDDVAVPVASPYAEGL
jgi:hypothetical protein